MSEIEVISTHCAFDGQIGFYRHLSSACNSTMRLAVYTPQQANQHPCPVLYYLAGLTCTEETFVIKGGALRLAARHGIIIVAPDTSPRGLGLPGETDNWDFGSGASFYVDATAPLWSAHYKMYSYVSKELPTLIGEHFNADGSRQGIFGHSMGGHGALVCALRNPERYRSVSAFAPVSAPIRCPWGRKAFTGYLGTDRSAWTRYDASELVRQRAFPGTILIDQGLADPFIDEQLLPGVFETACRDSGQALLYRGHQGYDHSYYFVSTFMEDHFLHHAQALNER